MKKFITILILILILFISLSIFVSSNYFFNKYIATNIKEYGFSYSYVNGKLFKGFSIEDLKYKGKTLSSNVDFKFNPYKLINGIISIKKLHLIGVQKDVLENVVNDFKSTDDSSSKVDIPFNFEFRDIFLMMKPFSIDGIKIKRTNLSIDSLSYIDSKFNIGDVVYETKSNIANFNFSGQFKNRVLNIDTITLQDFDLNKLVSILKKFKSDSNTTNNEVTNNSLIPKYINIKVASASLKPFNIEGINAKNLSINANNVSFDVKKLLLDNANIKLKYNSKEIDINASLSLKNRVLSINSLYIQGKNLNKLEDSIKKIISDLNSRNKDTNDKKIVPIDIINIRTSKIKVNNYRYKNETIKDLTLNLKNIFYYLKDSNSSIKADLIKLKLKSSIGDLFLDGNIKSKIIVNLLKIKSDSIDKLITLIPKSDNTHNSNLKLPIPKNILIKSLKIDAQKATFTPFILNTIKLVGSNIKINIINYIINSATLKVIANSNFGKAKLNGNINSNIYHAKGAYNPSQYLLDKYNIPLIAKNINPMQILGYFGLDKLKIDTTLSGENILKDIKGFSILSSKNIVKYNYITNNLSWSIDAKIKSPYTKKAYLKNLLTYKAEQDLLKYSGTLKPLEPIIDKSKFKTLFKNLKLTFKGNDNSIKVKLKSDKLKGNFISDYKSGKLTLLNNSNLSLNNYIDIGSNYSNLKVSNLKITSNINFKKIFPINGELLLKSNLLNLSGIWNYNNTLLSKLQIEIPKKSILLKDNKKIIYKNIKSFTSDLEVSRDFVNLNIKNSNMSSKINYIFSKKYINGNVKIGSLALNTYGKINNIKMNIKSKSIKKAIYSIEKIYKLDKSINIDGSINIDVSLLDNSKVSYLINSPKIIYKNKEKVTTINKINIKGNYINNILSINKYSFIANSYKIFDNKSNLIDFSNKNIIEVKSFWVNDALNFNGKYNIDTKKGKFIVKANRLKLKNRDAKVVLNIDTILNLNGDKKSIDGKIDIVDGLIKSTIARKNLADNKDIIILQRKKEKDNTEFAKNIKLNLLVKSQKGVIYSGDGANFRLIPNIKINKSYNSLSKFVGVVSIDKNGYYKLNDKKLKIIKGKIIFNGKSSAPNLNIQMGYYGRDYNIKINITGTPTRPILFFSSNPPLTKEQILAYLLFDDSSAVGTHSKEAMLNMIGGSLAKSLLGSIGIKVDHISVKENGFSIGKSISKNIVIYYNQNKNSASIKTKINLTKHINSEIEVGKDKQSVDLIFTKEY